MIEKDIKKIEKEQQKTINIIARLGEDRDLRFDSSKTKYMYFSRRNLLPHILQLKMNDEIIQ